MSSVTLRARWVIPVGTPPIENGYVVTQDGLIVEVGRGRGDYIGEVVALGDAVLLPGLVNAHTHLALTALRGRVPFKGSFVEWIKSLRSALVAVLDEGAFRASVEAGLRESVAAGVTAIADIGYGARSVAAWQTSPIRLLGFLEVLGMGVKRPGGHPQALDQAIEAIQRAPAGNDLLHLGLSPHAPYSTDALVYRHALDSSHRLCTHLAETKAELEFLRAGTGPFRDLLEEWKLWDGTFRPPGCSPVMYMRDLGVLQPDGDPLATPLLAHVNYVDDADLAILADSHPHIVYCPRTHAFFGHDPHRYREMLARGINVCLGTDSLASSDTLSILDELRFLRSIDSQLSDQALLEMATVNGAAALGFGSDSGTLAPGRRADLVAIPLNNAVTRDPLDDVMRGTFSPLRVLAGDR